jgi:hypothetical protein
MAEPDAETTRKSLKLASLAVDAVWYLCWAVTIFGIAAALVVWSFPQARETLVTRGVVRAETTFDLPLEVRYPSPASTSVSGAPPGAPQVLGHDNVVFAKPFDRGDLALYLLSRLLIAVVSLWTLFQLRALMHAVRRGHPFDPRNPARIRRIAWVLIAAGFIGDIVRPLWVGASFNTLVPIVKRALPGASVGYRITFSWELVVVGLIVLAIAQAFDAGARLQDDHDLTV